MPIRPFGPLVAALVFGITMFTWSWWRWWTFQYTTFDLAFYVQTLWCALRGIPVATLLDVPLLGNHAEPSVFLALPLFAVLPHPMLLVGIQVTAVATMPLLAWNICHRLGLVGRDALILSLCTLLTPSIAWATLHEFHPETLSAPLILGLFLAKLSERRIPFWILWLVLAGCKENLALMLIAWGLLFAYLERHRGFKHVLQWSLIPAAVAALWLGTYGLWLAPWLNGGKVAYGELYSHLGTSGTEVITGAFSNPGRVWNALVKGATQGDLLGGVLLPWLGLAILRPRWLLIAAPLIFQHLLSWRSSEWSIRFHYGAPLIGLTWIAVAEAISRIPSRHWWCIVVLIGSVIGQALIGPVKEFFHDLGDVSNQLALRSLRAMPLKDVDPADSVIASNGFLAHIACRRELHSLHHLLKGLKTLSRADYTPPESISLILIDYTDSTTFDTSAGFYHPQMRTKDGRTIASSDALLDSYLRSAQWSRKAVNGVSLFRQIGVAPAAKNSVEPLPLQLRNPRWENSAPGESHELVITYDVPAHRMTYPWALLIVTHGTDRFALQLGMLAAGAPAGDEIAERWQIYWPKSAPPGVYQSTLLVYDHIRATWSGQSPLALPETKQYNLGEIQLP